MLGSVPDVVGINRKSRVFWLELKALDGWPARDSTYPLKNAFEPGQVPFLKEWRGRGGWSYVMVKVGSGKAAQWLLLTPLGGSKELIECTRSELIQECAVCLGLDEIIQYLENL